MRSRRRQVVRVELRERALDVGMTVVAAVLVIVTTLTILPASVKDAGARAACSVFSLGLTDCQPRLYTAPAATLGPARCLPLSDLDVVVAEVRSQELAFPSGVSLTRSTTRDGTVYLEHGDVETRGQLPDLWVGEGRSTVPLVEGVNLLGSTRWRFPVATAEESLIRSIQHTHDAWTLGRSPLSLFVGAQDDDYVLPWDAGPSQLYSTVHPADVLGGSGTDSQPVAEISAGDLHLDRGVAAVLRTDRTDDTTWMTLALRASEEEDGSTAALRLGRDANGQIFSLSMVLLADEWPVSGDAPDQGGAEGSFVSYVHAAVSEPSEHRLIERWLERGAPVDLKVLLGQEAPRPDDTFGRFLTSGATVTVTRVSDTTRAADIATPVTWLARGLRDSADHAVQQVWVGPPAPSGSARELKENPACMGGAR